MGVSPGVTSLLGEDAVADLLGSEPVAVAGDVEYHRAVQQAVQHCRSVYVDIRRWGLNSYSRRRSAHMPRADPRGYAPVLAPQNGSQPKRRDCWADVSGRREVTIPLPCLVARPASRGRKRAPDGCGSPDRLVAHQRDWMGTIARRDP